MPRGLLRYGYCPCAKHPGESPPAFVGLDYFCESGMTGRWQDNKRIALEGCGGYVKTHCGTVMVVVQETAAEY